MKIFPAEPAVSGRTAPTSTIVRNSAWTRRRRRRRDRSPSRTAARSRPCSRRDARAEVRQGSKGKIARRRDGEAEGASSRYPPPSAPASSSCASSALINRCAVERPETGPARDVREGRRPGLDRIEDRDRAVEDPDAGPRAVVLPRAEMLRPSGIATIMPTMVSSSSIPELDDWPHRGRTFDAADAVGEDGERHVVHRAAGGRTSSSICISFTR